MSDGTILTQTQLRLLNYDTIDLTGKVNLKMVDYCREAMIRLVSEGSPPCHILINSSGGNVKFGLDIFDLISHYPSQTTGVILNYSYSMAAIILQACQKRLITKNSYLLIHNPSPENPSWNQIFDPKEHRRLKKILKEVQAKIIEILMERTGQSEEKIIAALDEGKEMTALEALRFGLVDEISQPERIINGKTS